MKPALGVLLSSLIVFFWGFVFFGLLGGLGAIKMNADNEAVQEVLRTAVPGNGTYFVPGMSAEDFEALHERGPIATIHVRKSGLPAMSPTVMVKGFVHMLATTLLVLLLLKVIGPLPAGKQFAIILAAGLASAFWTQLAMPIWWYHPWGFYVKYFLYDVVAWGLVGLILPRFLGGHGAAAG